MSECKHADEWIKSLQGNIEELSIENIELRAQVAVMQQVLELCYVAVKALTKDNVSGLQSPLVGSIQQALSTTPPEAAERVSKLVEALERISCQRMDFGGEIIPTEEAIWAMSALAQWRRHD